MSDPQDLVEWLADAARGAVLARRGAIESGGPGNLRAITVELELSNFGAVLDVTSFLSWKSAIRQATRGSR